jgi:hypothetical protein
MNPAFLLLGACKVKNRPPGLFAEFEITSFFKYRKKKGKRQEKTGIRRGQRRFLHFPGNYQVLEEILTAKSKKSKK